MTACCDVAAESPNSLDANSVFCHTFRVLILTLLPLQLPLLVPVLDFADVLLFAAFCIMSLLLLMLGYFGDDKKKTHTRHHISTNKQTQVTTSSTNTRTARQMWRTCFLFTSAMHITVAFCVPVCRCGM